MRKALSSAGVLVALLAAVPANAAPIINYNTAAADGSFTASFENASPSASFNDLFTPFTVAVGGYLSATLTTIGIFPKNDVDFTLAQFNGAGGFIPLTITKSPLTSGNKTNPDGLEFGIVAGQPIGPGTYQLQVKGTAPGTGGNGSYAGTVSFAAGAVPEPSTWAVMILGFGAVGFAMRRQRSRNNVKVSYRLAHA